MQGGRNSEHPRQPRSPRFHPSSKSTLSPLSHSRLVGFQPPSPPVAVVHVRGQTLIAPNSTLARAVVMGNQESTYNSSGSPNRNDFSNYHIHHNANPRTRTPAYSSNDSPHETLRPVSNLTVLLNQQQHAEAPRVIQQEVAEADTASGPSYMVPLGRSAPDFDSRLMPTQFTRQLSTAATQLTDDKVRR